MQYKTGVYTPRSHQKQGMHAVTAIGYGPDYILAVNSWGESWGDNGLFKIKAGCCGMIFWPPSDTNIVDKSAFPLPSGGNAADFRRRSPTPRRRRSGGG